MQPPVLGLMGIPIVCVSTVCQLTKYKSGMGQIFSLPEAIFNDQESPLFHFDVMSANHYKANSSLSQHIPYDTQMGFSE